MLPQGLQSGVADWYEARQYGGTGRLLQSNPSEYAARSFSCGYTSVIIGADWYPNVTSEAVTTTNNFGTLYAQVGLTEDPQACGGEYVGDDDDYLYGWSSSDTSIATIYGSSGGYADYGVYVTGVSAGTTLINGTVTDQYGCHSGGNWNITITD